MARQNDSLLYGAVSAEPVISKDMYGKNIRGVITVSVLRSTRSSGEKNDKNKLIWDYITVLSMDEEMIDQMEKLKQFDVVEVTGPFVTRKITKNKMCPHCGKFNRIESSICYIMPTFLAKRNDTSLTEYEAAKMVRDNREISNRITILGNLCNDVNYYKRGNIESAVYQIGTERKLFVNSDEPVNRADFPVIRTFGHNAHMDNICIHKSSLVFIDGYLYFKKFERNSTCEVCANEFQWDDSTIEIVPYTIEYLANFTDPEDAAREEEEKAKQEAESLYKGLLAN